eukprot:Nitzschia sp. Nitz4//scaffold38_size140716//111425//112328//NITZ4_003163-RA/size140716-augustus-gene-0.138-mRNA-1//-1//CDS//3329550126//7948//frame0
MAESYEDYEKEYNEHLSKIRTFLAGTRTRGTLEECERLLGSAKKCATAMQGLAEVEGNPMKIREASQRVERDIGPLSKEIQRALNDGNREDLFYQAPNAMGSPGRDMESLIASSDDMLRESQALAMETEQIGNATLSQMTRQREQLQNANSNVDATLAVAQQAGVILRGMSRKAFRNKLFLYCMIGVLLVANFYALKRLFK